MHTIQGSKFTNYWRLLESFTSWNGLNHHDTPWFYLKGAHHCSYGHPDAGRCQRAAEERASSLLVLTRLEVLQVLLPTFPRW